MKTLAVSLTAFLFILLTFTDKTYSDDGFRLGFTGAYPNMYIYTGSSGHNWSWYQELSMNTWSGWFIGGNNRRLKEATEVVINRMANYDIDGYLMPDTIRWAGAGRVLVTEAENDNGMRFSYNNHHSLGTPVTDVWQGSTQRVQYYEVNPSVMPTLSPALTGVKENGFQSVSNLAYDPLYQVPFPYNNYIDTTTSIPVKHWNFYYIKPRMRINSSDVNNNAPNKEVVKIIVKKYNGLLADSLTIYTNDFKNSQGTYDGSYKEYYKGYNLSIRGDVINAIGETGGRPLEEYFPYLLPYCQVDYQIYWYGEVSVWIDYVKVMDEAAYMLFNEGQDGIRLRNAIQQKINFIKNLDTEGRIKGFYMEEVDYSNIACMQYLNEHMPEWSDDEYGLVLTW